LHQLLSSLHVAQAAQQASVMAVSQQCRRVRRRARASPVASENSKNKLRPRHFVLSSNFRPPDASVGLTVAWLLAEASCMAEVEGNQQQWLYYGKITCHLKK